MKEKYKYEIRQIDARIETDGSLYEILDRKTLEPLFCAVPMF